MKKLASELKECGNEKCRKKFKPPKDNPGQEYCSDKCWQVAHEIEGGKSK